MQRILFFLLILVVVTSGCVAGGGGAGVIIENFAPDFSSVFIEEDVNFRVKIKNAGSVDSPGGKVKILGMDDWGGGTGGAGGAGECTYTGKLLAAQPSFGTTGEVLVCDPFTFKAPKVPQGLPVTYQPTARLSYSYGSSIVKTLTLASQQELRRIENLGGALPAETTAVSSSPVTINVLTKGPIRVFTNGVKFPIEITVANTGGGVVCKGDHTACDTNDNWNRISITTTIGGKEESGCSKPDLTLFRGQSNSITCQVQLSIPQGGGILQKTIQVEASYGYFVDRLTTVTVNWRDIT